MIVYILGRLLRPGQYKELREKGIPLVRGSSSACAWRGGDSVTLYIDRVLCQVFRNDSIML
jgi:hypothetical protein